MRLVRPDQRRRRPAPEKAAGFCPWCYNSASPRANHGRAAVRAGSDGRKPKERRAPFSYFVLCTCTLCGRYSATLNSERFSWLSEALEGALRSRRGEKGVTWYPDYVLIAEAQGVFVPSSEMRSSSTWLMLASVALSGAAFLPGGLPIRSAVSPQVPRAAAVTMNTDYYGRLGLQRNADEKEIKNVSAAGTRVASRPCRVCPLPLASALARSCPVLHLTRHLFVCRLTGDRPGSGTQTSTPARRPRRNSSPSAKPTR